jgi:hypothetical protein
MLAAVGCALVGVLYFAGLKSDIVVKYGAAGKAFTVTVTVLTARPWNAVDTNVH